MSAHTPVLLKEVLEALDPKPGDFIIDGTIDGGGHSRAIWERIQPDGKLLGLDWDPEMIREQSAHLGSERGVTLAHGNYADLPQILREKRLGKANGLLLDLGFSSEQLDPPSGGPGKGFSFSPPAGGELLQMTYDPSRPSVAEILRTIPEEELAKIIREFGGERFAGRIAHAIKVRGRRDPIRTTGELAEAIRSAAPKHYERGRIDPATRTFQALRIYANDELGNLAHALRSLPEILQKGGRVAVVSFHSLEDKAVKENFRTLTKEKKLTLRMKKPLTPSREEIRQNPRSRSGKLRTAVMN